MIRVSIVEDEKEYQEKLEMYLKAYAKKKGIDLSITIYSDGEDFLADYTTQFDVVLLDVVMKSVDGMTTAQKIRQRDKDVVLVFITSMAQYALQSYTVAARGYLLKPFTYKEISLQMDKVCQELYKREDRFLCLTTTLGLKNINCRELVYVESDGHYINIHLTGEEIRFLSSLKDFEKKLDPKKFARCNSGVVVNLQYVDKIQDSTVYVGESSFPISRGRKKAFLDALADYIGGDPHA